MSLRSRSWLRKAIQYCPTSTFANSGLTRQQFDTAPCRATRIAAEDIYFVTILRGIGAPLPSNLEAALFSLELRTPPMIAEQYHLNDTFLENMVQKRWYSPNDPSGMEYYRTMMGHQHNLSQGMIDRLVPIGIHKPWNKYVSKRITETYLNEQCPYMIKVVENSKYGRKYLI